MRPRRNPMETKGGYLWFSSCLNRGRVRERRKGPKEARRRMEDSKGKCHLGSKWLPKIPITKRFLIQHLTPTRLSIYRYQLQQNRHSRRIKNKSQVINHKFKVQGSVHMHKTQRKEN